MIPAASPIIGEDERVAVDVAILRTDHVEYPGLAPADLPGAAVLVDGRNWTSAASFDGSVIARVVIGG